MQRNKCLGRGCRDTINKKDQRIKIHIPHALQIVCPSLARLHNGVVVVPQLAQLVAETPVFLPPAIVVVVVVPVVGADGVDVDVGVDVVGEALSVSCASCGEDVALEASTLVGCGDNDLVEASAISVSCSYGRPESCSIGSPESEPYSSSISYSSSSPSSSSSSSYSLSCWRW